ncbi:MAG TPA: hypothetical protein VFG62_06165 [Rhodopila sp.]|nr:hypothetical protein [Rhodopila sp.]
MLAAILPDTTQLALVAATAFVAALCAGLGHWIGVRRVEIALLAGWGVAGLATVVVGTLTSLPLTPVLAGLGLAGITGLVHAAPLRLGPLRLVRTGAEPSLFGRIVLLALPLFAVTASMQTTAWDDFSHWLPNLAYLCAHDHFPTLLEPSGSYHAAYPYGLALPGLAVYRLFGLDPDNVALVWNQIMILAAAASVARVLRRRLAPDGKAADWSCAALGLLFAGLAAPSFVAKIVFTNMADAATGATLAVLLGLFADWIAEPANRTRHALAFALGCVALLNLRQANGALYGLLLLGALLAAAGNRRQMRDGAGFALLTAIVLPFAATLLWSRYAKAQIPGGEFSIMPLGDWRWAMLPQIVGSMLKVMVSKVGLFGLILALALRAGFALRPSDKLAPWQRGAVVAGAFAAAGMIGFLGFSYLAANFAEIEAEAAASFWRYMGETGPLAVLAAAAVIPLGSWRRLPPRGVAIGLVAATLVAPLAFARSLRPDLASPVPHLRAVGNAVARLVPPEASVTLLDLTGDGFPLLIVDYDLSLSVPAQAGPPRSVTKIYSTQGMTPAEAAKRDLSHAAYIFLAEGAAQAATRFGVPLGTGCSYLLQHESGRYTVLARWPIGRYRWATVGKGWTAAEDPACR